MLKNLTFFPCVLVLFTSREDAYDSQIYLDYKIQDL